MHASAAKTVTGHFDTGITQPINVVLILGESTRAASMHCYGYALPTTPQLDQLHAQKELAVFTDAVSPSNATIASTQAVLTFYTNEQDKARWHEFPDLVSVMKHGGFATAWVTNQECSGGPWSVQPAVRFRRRHPHRQSLSFAPDQRHVSVRFVVLR